MLNLFLISMADMLKKDKSRIGIVNRCRHATTGRKRNQVECVTQSINLQMQMIKTESS